MEIRKDDAPLNMTPCPNCGRHVHDRAVACPHCGERIYVVSPGDITPTRHAPVDVPRTPESPDNAEGRKPHRR